MTLERLRIFLCVAKHRNFTIAARELHTTQPSVSRHLKSLEREYGIALYRVVKTGIELTEAGEKFLHHTGALLSQYDQFKTAIKAPTSVQSDLGSMIKIGGSFGAFAHLLPAAIANFRATQPDIQIESHTAASPVLEQELLDSKIDLAVLTRPRYVPSLVYEPCGREKVIAVVGSRHPFAKTGTLSPAGLARVPLLIRSRLSGTVSKVEARLREFEKQGIAPRIVMYCDSHSTLLASVKKGAGVGFIRSGCLVGNALKNDVRVLRTPWLDLFYDSYAVYPKEKPMTAAALEFLQLLRKDFTKRINAPMQKRQFRLRKQKRV